MGGGGFILNRQNPLLLSKHDESYVSLSTTTVPKSEAFFVLIFSFFFCIVFCLFAV